MRPSLPFAFVFAVVGLPAAACAPGEGAQADTGGLAEEAPTFLPYAADGLSVEALAPERYLGLWYEIATTPSFIQENCHGTTAEYGLVDEDTISVYNRCRLGSLDGRLNEIEGTADFVDDSFARLLVDFGFGFDAPYNVIELDGSDGDAPYRYAAVSSANVQLWVLARAPTLDAAVYDAVVARMAAQGLATDELVRTEHATE